MKTSQNFSERIEHFDTKANSLRKIIKPIPKFDTNPEYAASCTTIPSSICHTLLPTTNITNKYKCVWIRF